MAEKIKVEIKALDKFSGVFNKFASRMPSMKQLAVGTGVAVAGAGAALLAMAKSTATAYDKIQKFSDQLGISTEFISKMNVAAEFSGVQAKTMEKSIQSLTVRLGEASRGIGEGKDAFESLGIPLRDVSGNLKTAEQLMPELAEGFHNMSNATEKAEVASKLFGQRGIQMLQIFKNGKEGLKAMTDEAEKFGLVVSAKAGANAAEFNDSLTRLTGSFKGLKNYVGEQVMPTMTALANRMADWIANNRDKIIEFGSKVVQVFGKMLEVGAYVVAGLVDAWRGLKMIWEVLKIAFAGYVEAYLTGLQWMIEKYRNFLSAINVGGVFDDAIASVDRFANATGGAIANVEAMGKSANDNLNKIIDEGLAVNKVTEFVEVVKEEMAKLSEAGQGTVATGVGPFTDGNLNKAKENIQANKEAVEEAYAELNEMWLNENTTEEERLLLWYETQQELFVNHEEALTKLKEVYLKRRQAIEKRGMKEQTAEFKKNIDAQKKIEADKNAWAQSQLAGGVAALKSFGEKGKKAYKVIMIAQATISTFAGAARALADYQYPYSLVVAAAAIASGMAQISKIRSAHGGLTNVPREQTYLLDRNERVLSPNQNKDFTEFIKAENQGVVIENITNQIHIGENITTLDNLKNIDENELDDWVEGSLVPSFKRLSNFGVTI